MRRTGALITAVLCLFSIANAQQSPAHSTDSVAPSGSGCLQEQLIAGGIDNTLNLQGTHPALHSAEIYHSASGRFVRIPPMNAGRVAHDATLLADGEVLMTGGDGIPSDRPIASAETYSPTSSLFTLTGAMTTARVGHSAVLLPNGMVLVAGGQNQRFENQNTAELFDPVSRTFSSTGPMTDARTGHTAILLNTGQVLIAGGENSTDILSSAELYDPATGTFTPTGAMTIPRIFATATLLSDGRVLIAGGGTQTTTCGGCSVASAEVYDPTAATFTSVGNMRFSRRGHVAAELPNHNVLIAGGIDDSLGTKILSSAEIFHLDSLAFSVTGAMTTVRYVPTASVLCNGEVLITGGFDGGSSITNTAEIYNLKTHSFTATGNMTDARASHTGTALSPP